jgi:hypothetical protein
MNKDGNVRESIFLAKLGDFMYYEFFKAFSVGNTIKRCKHCGKFFLNATNYEVEYCDNVYDEISGKTCRVLGAEKSHQEKVKNNPVLLVYQRAYKAHYARVLKKKMTKNEFSEWGEWAIEMREKALKGEIPFDEYERELKK